MPFMCVCFLPLLLRIEDGRKVKNHPACFAQNQHHSTGPKYMVCKGISGGVNRDLGLSVANTSKIAFNEEIWEF